MRFHICFCLFSWYSIGIMSSGIELKICVITARIKKYKSIIKKKKKKQEEIKNSNAK